MIYVVTGDLTVNDLHIINTMMHATRYPFYKIVDLSGEMPAKEEILAAQVILVYDETKAVSSFQKKLRELYGKEIETELKAIRIDKPNTFMKSEESKRAVWKAVTEYCNLVVRQLSESQLPKNPINNELVQRLKDVTCDTVYILKDGKEGELEIRPNNFPASKKYSLTYDELNVILALRTLFKFSKIELINGR